MTHKIKPYVIIDITVTNMCNQHCVYCFENDHTCRYSLDKTLFEKKTISLLLEYCQNFDTSKFSGVHVSFWGGEPLLNKNFIVQVMTALAEFDFVNYFIYSNGTLVDEWHDLTDTIQALSLSKNFQVQLSYDGEPHQRILRGYSGKSTLGVFDFLLANQIAVSLKATLSPCQFENLPQIWDSYYSLYKKWGNAVYYSPTLDLTDSASHYLSTWQNALRNDILKRELSFYRKYQRFLWSWFKDLDMKGGCLANNRIHIHSDGNLYICHGCPYLKNKEHISIANVVELDSLRTCLANSPSHEQNLPTKCLNCSATYCSICHALLLNTEHDYHDMLKNWQICRTKNLPQCKYYQIFGDESRILTTAIDIG